MMRCVQRRGWLAALLAGAIIVVALGTETARAAAPLRLGSVTDARFGTTWTLDGASMAKTREKLLHPGNFGPAGTVARAVTITHTGAAPGSIDATLLAGFDVFFIGYLDDGNANAFTAGELTAMETWVTGGGVLVVTCDDSGHDAVCAHFGYPAATSATDPMKPVGEGIGHPIFNGPFGLVAEFQMGGTQGYFTTTVGATVLAQDSAGAPHPIFLVRRLGAGWVVLFADVNIISAELTDGTGITNANDRVMANLFALAGNVAALRVGSVAASRFGSTFTLDGAQMANTRAKLLDPANFGANGTFPRAVRITDTAATPGSIDATLLAGFDVFFIGYLDDGNANAFTAGELAAMADWVSAGGTLIVTCDEEGYDAVCAHFGHPAATTATDPMVPVGPGPAHPIFSGPFGAVPDFQMSGTQGFFTSTTGATVLAADSSGSAHPVFLVKQVGAGTVVLFADVDIIARAASDGSGISDNNDRLLGNLFAFAGAPGLRVFASVLPLSRSVQVGGTPATAFATILVQGLGLATDCTISPVTPVSAVFGFRPTDPFTNEAVGTLNAPVPISGGAARTFVFSFVPTDAFGPTEVQLRFDCTNTAGAAPISGVNTLLLLASATPVPDIVALSATLDSDGRVKIPGNTGSGVFAVATVNVGAAGEITASANTGTQVLPVSPLICRTGAGGLCATDILPSVTTTIDPLATPTFGVFVPATGAVPFDPATNRIFVIFTGPGGVLHGATSVSVETVPVP